MRWRRDQGAPSVTLTDSREIELGGTEQSRPCTRPPPRPFLRRKYLDLSRVLPGGRGP